MSTDELVLRLKKEIERLNARYKDAENLVEVVHQSRLEFYKENEKLWDKVHKLEEFRRLVETSPKDALHLLPLAAQALNGE